MLLRRAARLSCVLRHAEPLLPTPVAAPLVAPTARGVRAYHKNVIDHYESPRNVGSFDKTDPNVGTGLVGAPACGDVMKLQIKVRLAPAWRASCQATRGGAPRSVGTGGGAASHIGLFAFLCPLLLRTRAL